MLVCVHRQRVWKDSERKLVGKVHRHCSAGEGAWKAQPKNIQQGAAPSGSRSGHVASLVILIHWKTTSHTYHSWPHCPPITFQVTMPYPLIISLHSARMKFSFSGVRMHNEFFWPVLDSPSMTSEHWFILIVPCGSVVGCGTQQRCTKY